MKVYSQDEIPGMKQSSTKYKEYELNGVRKIVNVTSEAGIKWLKENPSAVLVEQPSEKEPPKKKTGSTESAPVEPKTQAQREDTESFSISGFSASQFKEYEDKALYGALFPEVEKENAKQKEVKQERLAKAFEDADLAKLSYEDDIDLRNMKTVVDKDEDLVIKTFLDDPKYSGLNIEKAGIAFGNAVTFQLPDGAETIYVDLKPFTDAGKKEAVKQLEKIDEWYLKNAHLVTPDRLALADALGRRLGGGIKQREIFDVEDVESINDMLNGSGYQIKTNGFDKNQLLKNGIPVRVFGEDNPGTIVHNAALIQSYLWKNMTDDEISKVTQKTREAAQDLQEQASTEERREYFRITDDEAIKNLANSGATQEYLSQGFESLGIEDEITSEINNYLSTDVIITKTISTTMGSWDSRSRDPDSKHIRYSSLRQALSDGFYIDEGGVRLEINLTPEQRQKALKALETGFAENGVMAEYEKQDIEAYKRSTSANFGSLYLEQKFRNSPEFVGIRAYQDQATSRYTLDQQIEAHKAKANFIEQQFEELVEEQELALDSFYKDAKEAGIGIEPVGEGEDLHFVITADNPDVKEEYQRRINKIMSSAKFKHGEINKAYSAFSKNFNRWQNESQENAEFASTINKEFGKMKVLEEDFEKALESMFVSSAAFLTGKTGRYLLGISGVLGELTGATDAINEAAMDRMRSTESGTEAFETALTFEQASELGAEGRYAARTVAQQLPNTLVAIGATAVGVPPIATAMLFGTSSGGQKMLELENRVEMGAQATKQIAALDTYKDTMDPLEYKRARARLIKQEALGNLSPYQIEAAIWSAAIIEGGITYCLGTIPNSAKFVKEFSKGVPSTGYLISRSNLMAAKDAAFDFTKRVGGEILEEELIYGFSELSDGLITGKDMDFSNWDEVLISSVLMAGPMNGAPIVYSTILSQVANKSAISGIMSDIEVLQRNIENLKPEDRGSEYERTLQIEYADALVQLEVVGAGLEVDALVTGPKNLRTLIANSLDLKILYDEAGVLATDSQDVKKQKIADHKAKLTSTNPEAAEAFAYRLDKVLSKVENIQSQTRQRLEDGEIEQLVEKHFTKKGLDVLEKLSKSDDFNGLSNRDKMTKVNQELKKSERKNRIEQARKRDNIKKAVEQRLYGGSFEKSGRKRRKKKQEEELYDTLAKMHNAVYNSSILSLRNDKKSVDYIKKHYGDFKDMKFDKIETVEEFEDFLRRNHDNLSSREKRDAIKAFKEGTIKALIAPNGNVAVAASENTIEQDLKNGDFDAASVSGVVYAHEFFHAVDDITLKEGEMQQLSTQLKKALTGGSTRLKAVHAKVMARLESVKRDDPNLNEVDEYIKYALDELRGHSGMFALADARKSSQGLLNMLRGTALSRKVGLGDYKFDSPEAALNYVVEFIDSFESGHLSKSIQRKMETFKKEGGAAKLDEKGLRASAAGNDVTDTVDELGKMGWDNSTWKDSGGYSFALTEMQENKMLDRLIASKLKVPMSPDDTREFVAKVYAELTSHVKNFRPEDNDSLFGWINSQLSNKAGNVYNREYKATEETRGVDIDATTSEGNPVIQIADDVDYEMARIDDIGLNDQQRDDKSRLRRDLGLNEEMIDKVKNAVIKTFGTKLPSVDAKDFKKALEKAFATELKKPIQDMMGGREDFDMFLVDHFSAVFDALPASTLVQMERNLDPEQRIFTTSERITKPTEVDRLVSEGRLPKDVNRLSGPMLHTKKPTPNTRQVLAYFRGKDMQNVLGYKVGGSTLGTRKDKLAIEIGVELAFDATSEVIQMPEVQERRKNILELQGYEMLENDVAMIAKVIDRDPSIKFSKIGSNKKPLIYKGVLNKDIDVLSSRIDEIVGRMRAEKVSLKSTKKVIGLLEAEFGNEISEESIKAIAKNFKGYAYQFDSILRKSKPSELKKPADERMLSSEDVYDFALNRSNTEAEIASNGLYKMMFDVLPDASSIASLYTDENIELSRAATKAFFENINETEGREAMLMAAKIMVSSFAGNRTGYINNVDDYKKLLGISEPEWQSVKNPVKDQTAKGYLKDKDYKGRKKLSEKAQELLVKMMKFYVDGIKNEFSSIDYPQLAMVLNSMNGNTHGLLRIAATLEYVDVDIDKVPVDKANSLYRYEHVTPVVKKMTELYNDMMSGKEIGNDYFNDYVVALIPQTMDNALNTKGFRVSMNSQYKKGDNPLNRYYNVMAATTGKLVAVKSLGDGKVYGDDYARVSKLFAEKKPKLAVYAMNAPGFEIRYSKTGEINPKGMSTFDFDETLIIHGENFIVATKDGKELKISSGDWPLKGPALQQEGWEFDFSDFVNVRGGVEGPLLQKMRNQIEKFGNKNVFVLTARPAEAQLPIYEWLKSKGIELPIENITGLGDGRGEAKAAWMLKKYSEGYNDMYFVDDALPNVKAVKQVMDEFDIKGKSVQAMIKFSKTASEDFNDMLERVSGVRSGKTFSGYEAKVEGKGKGRFKFFVPPSAEDFKGLMYSFLGKGKQGDADLKWFEENLFVPYAKAVREFDSFNQTVSEDYAKIRSEFNDVTSRFKDEVPGTKLNLEQAIRVFLFAQADVKIPGMDSTTISVVREYMKNDEAASAFAVALSQVTRNKRGYVKPKQYWLSGNIASDLVVNSQEARKNLFKEWSNKKDLVFSESNMNKIEAIYGPNFREALDNTLWRMENGTNKYRTGDPIVNKFVNWINGSVGAVMFFNMRSAVLQTMSAVNYINWSDNNLFEASKAFANQKQYWSDVSTLFNSDMLKQRRSGLKIDVSASELSNAFNTSGGKVEGVISWLLEKGFKPTQIADSLAIATGGATFYRNRIKKYLKDGLDKSKAEEQAFMDFMEITEENQQSSRPDLVSQQQAGPLGRMILAWQNTPMQYTRLTKKALSDLVNGRGDWKTNTSKILYYGMVQNVLFGAIQSGLMFMMFGGDDDEEELNKKSLRVANGTLDTLLRGTGVYGAAAATLKNVIMKWYEESEKGFGKKDMSKVAVEMVNLSPPIGSKVRKVMNAIKSYDYNKDVMKKMDYSFNNPGWDVLSNLVEATTNVPLARVVNKAKNVELALSATTDPWQKAALMLGWNKWDIGLEDVELEEARKSVKEDKAEAAKERREVRKEETKAEREVQKEQEAKEKEEQGIKQVQCSHIKNDGSRCKVMVETKKDTALCQYHKNYDEKEGSDINNDGVKEFQCTATTSSGKRCKNRTENKNKRCYAHQ